MSLETNKQIVRRFYEECLNQGNLASVESVIAPQFVDHSYNLQGVAAVQQFVQESHQRFSDLQFMIEALIAEGPLVAVRWRGQGRHQNGKSAHWTGMGFYHVQDGKITAHWANVDQLGLRQQLGLDSQ